MSYEAHVHNVMIASPSDVIAERGLIRQAIDEFNATHAARSRCVLLPRHWESHSTPRMGARPQGIINQQLVKDSDLLVAVFWTRIGTPTGVSASGTIEEIEEHIEAGKPVMLYFSNQPVVLGSVDPEQYEALVNFKRKCEKGGLIREYSDLDEFYRVFFRHLQQTVFDELCTGESELPSATEVVPAEAISDLPEDALRLLNEAAEDQHGYVLSIHTLSGFQIQTNGREFVNQGDPRSEAQWEAVLERLLAEGLLTGSTDGLCRMTALGYRIADANLAWWRRPGAPQFRLSLASTRRGSPWTFEATVEQYDGTDIGDLQAEWFGTAVSAVGGAPRSDGARRWRLPSAEVTPESAGGEGFAVEIRLRFRWQNRVRTMAWRWPTPADFQTTAAEEIRA